MTHFSVFGYRSHESSAFVTPVPVVMTRVDDAIACYYYNIDLHEYL